MSKVLRKHLARQADHGMMTPTLAEAGVAAQVMEFIQSDGFPCVGAKAALVQGNIDFRLYGSLTDPACETSLHLDLQEYIGALDLSGPRIQSFAAIFLGTPTLTEADFETQLWDRLKGLSDLNEAMDFDWNEHVSSDPDNPHFSMSLAGHPFFIVGMHPQASRLARRSPFAMLVFNSNLQFDALKADGRYAQLQAIIRERDAALQGTINPNLADFGDASEARQYAGRKVDGDWTCPVHFKGRS